MNKYTAPELKAFGTVADLTGYVGPSGSADALYLGVSNTPVAINEEFGSQGVPQLDCYFGSGGQYLGIDDGRVNGDNPLDSTYEGDCRTALANYNDSMMP